MKQTWRWFGPADRVTLRDAREAGATGIVTALHEIPPGEVWPIHLIRQRLQEIQRAGLEWSVVESLDVSECLKMRGQGWQLHLDNFQLSLRNLAACGIRTVAYNWMPLLSWMRTHLHAPAPRGGYTTRFDAIAFAAFDLYLLRRPQAAIDWGEDCAQAAHSYLQQLSQPEIDTLQQNILQGLPGGNGSFSLEQVRDLLAAYSGLTDADLRGHLATFLRTVCPVAEELGITLCIHPDDPPRPLLGLPRIVSTASDLEWILAQYQGHSNALTFCTGALGVRPDNDLLSMVRTFADRIGFFHLRSTQREPTLADAPESFLETEHLEGDADLIAIVIEIMKQQRRRMAEGTTGDLPFRADHGQELLCDRRRGAAPGYPAIGRLRGLAELRGAMLMAERLLQDLE
ncbi:MAG: mannonate dehydratase [Edaphobacter sp.]|uniref:mannonate dehydratase n=1 Tax=Edaphobacter sp. TaxID=1934404 RepID=UPI00238F98B4|nr:mannonate dehydratase [Edaphobacter sp.]MDE1177300.1 mannonate dehydratase [Edaphobacter sp.]